MNVAIRIRGTGEVVVRYEIAGVEDPNAAEEVYFDEAWRRAVDDRLVDSAERHNYVFHVQRPETLYEAPR